MGADALELFGLLNHKYLDSYGILRDTWASFSTSEQEKVLREVFLLDSGSQVWVAQYSDLTARQLVFNAGLVTDVSAPRKDVHKAMWSYLVQKGQAEGTLPRYYQAVVVQVLNFHHRKDPYLRK